jgi:hypothetical protein
MSSEPGRFAPITGTFKPPRMLRGTLPQSIGYNRAFANALKQAARTWEKPSSVTVDVEFRAQIDVWNPGGVGAYIVVLNPHG